MKVEGPIMEEAVEAIRKEYEEKIKKMREKYEDVVKDLEQRVSFLEETNSSKRVMLEDAINYTAELEARIKAVEDKQL